MEFYFDENIPAAIVNALICLDRVEYSEKHRLYLTTEVFGRGAPDEEIFPSIAGNNGVIVTNDLKIFRKGIQRHLIHEIPVGTFFIHFASGTPFWTRSEIIIKQWPAIVKQANKAHKNKPYSYLVKNGKILPL